MRYLMLNKPQGYITACQDAKQKTIMDLLPKEAAKGLHPIGRLDIDTEGLLLLTDDGQLTHRLMQPAFHVEKTYEIYGIGKLTPARMKMLEQGVPLDAEGTISRPAAVSLLRECTVADIAEFLPPERAERYLQNPCGDAFVARLTIHEGKKHQVKRMLRAVSCRVCRLKRVSIGGIVLDDSLQTGAFRELSHDEIALLHTYE